MTERPPNRNALWARSFVDELARGGVEAVCLAPGSRSTPLTVAFAAHPEIEVYSHLDERSAAYFALGRARRTGDVTPVVSTSGTATANFHPAVLEADRARVPLLVLTADRPPELRDSGANQTVDQEKLYGSAVRWYRDLPEPAPDARKLRSLRVTVGRALAEARGTPAPAGPVHLNVPFRKPLEPVEVPGDVPEGFADASPLAAEGRSEGPFVRTTGGETRLSESAFDRVAEALGDADRPLVVAGPADPASLASTGDDGSDEYRRAIADLARAAGAPLLADPLSGVRFGPHAGDADADSGVLVCSGYDAYLDDRVSDAWPDPDVVLRVGASSTSKVLRNYLRDVDARQFLVDPAGGWREATFAASDLLVTDPAPLAGALADRLEGSANSAWHERFGGAERTYAEHAAAAHDERFFEGTVAADALALAPDPATVFVSNSMPVRDVDRFGRARAADLDVLGNRGASGIDGIVSTALGAGSATDEPLVCLLGDLAFYHDMNGLLAVGRSGVDATIVLVNNDGGGIFHMLPIEGFDPPFTGQFKTPHGLDFSPTGDLYGLEFARAEGREAFRETYRRSLAREGTQVIEVPLDGEASHRHREAVQDAVCDELAGE